MALDKATQGKTGGITSRQAAELLSLLRRIEQNTGETNEATQSVRDALGELKNELSNLGTMVE